MHAQAVRRQALPFQAPIGWAALAAIALLLIGPFIDPYFAQRSPDHSHLGPNYAVPHIHVYDMDVSKLGLPLQAQRQVNAAATGGPIMLSAEEAAPGIAFLSPSAPSATADLVYAPDKPTLWQSLERPPAPIGQSSIAPLKQPPR